MRRNKAQKVVKILDKILKLEANSASCMFAYEPKAPKELERFIYLFNTIFIQPIQYLSSEMTYSMSEMTSTYKIYIYFN